MKLSNLTSALSTGFAKTKFTLKKNSPEIALAAGIMGLVGAAVMACRATVKASEVSETAERRLKDIETAPERIKDYSEDDAKKDTFITYTQMVVGYGKLYLPAIGVAALSIASILYSHNVLSKRNASLATAYALVTKSYKEYRKRIADEIGEDKENDIFHKAEHIKAEITEITEDGKTKKKKVDKIIAGDLSFSPYARFFDEANRNWEPNAEYNLDFLRMVENQMTNRLRANGHLFLNEVYDALGMDRSDLGQSIGWVYDPDSDISDNFVDFGIYNANKPKNRDFVNGYENVIIIDPNVDGDIMTRVFKEVHSRVW